jgi:hypothetical protein
LYAEITLNLTKKEPFAAVTEVLEDGADIDSGKPLNYGKSLTSSDSGR